MGFQAKGDGCNASPSLVCDFCSEEITDWTDGNVEYDDFPDKGRSETVKFHHKRCSAALHQLGRGSMCWFELVNYLTWLIANNKWAPEKNGKLTITIHEPLGI